MRQLIIPIFCIISNLIFAQNQKAREKHFNVHKNVILNEYDAVSYFIGKPVKGNSAFKETYEGLIYLFSTEKNREIFKKEPFKYEPAYGGWCAYAMGNDGSKVEVDPLTFKIINGKLYLFYNFYFNNTLKKWNLNEAELKSMADKNWNSLLK